MALKKVVDFENMKPFHITRNVLTWHFLLPPEDQMQSVTRSRIKAVILVLGNVIFSLVPLGYLASEEIRHKEWMQMSSSLADALCFIGLCSAYVIGVSVQHHLVWLIENTPEHSEYGIPEKFFKERHRVNLLAFICYIYINCCCISKQLLAYLNEDNCKKTISKYRFDVLCNAFVPVAWLFDADSSWLKFFWKSAQFVFAYHIFGGIAEGAYMLYEMSSYIVIRVRHLNSKLLVMFDSESKSIQAANFLECVKIHKVAYEHAMALDSTFSPIMLVHFTATAIILGLYSNLILKRITEELTLEVVADAMFFFAWLFALLLACLSGEKIKSVFEEISVDLYESKWYNADISLRKSFRIMQFMCMQPVVLTTGAFGTLSFTLFVSIMKTAYSYIALIQQSMD